MAIFFQSAIVAQGFSYMHYDMKDGLPSPIIYGITQDQHGFIWLATENGLCRFDGRSFKTYTTKDGLPDNSILNVHADDSGRIFLLPFTHPPYILYNDSFYAAKYMPEEMGDMNTLSSFSRFGKYHLLNSYSTVILKGDSIVKFSRIITSSPKNAGYSSGASPDHYVAGSKDTMFLIDKGKITKSWAYRRGLDTTPFYRPDGSFVNLKKAGFPGMVHIANNFYERDLFILNIGDSLMAIDIKNDRQLWKLYMPKNTRAFIDDEENLWITTDGNGLYRIPSTDFRLLQPRERPQIFSFASTPGGLLIGGNPSKLYRCNVEDSVIHFVQEDLGVYLENSLNPIARTRNENRVTKILTQGDATYIGTDAFLLKLRRGAKPLFSHIFPIKDIDIVGSSLIACTGRNVVRLDPSTMVAKDTILKQRSTCGIFYNGQFYIGSAGGLVKIDLQTMKITPLNTIHPALRGRITDLQPGTNGDLWISTSSSGIVQFKNDKVVSIINESKGLTSDICTGIFLDGANLWVGTNQGLNKIDMSGPSPRIFSYTTANGLASDFVNAIYVDDKRVYVGGDQGMTYFNKNIESTKSICRLLITEVSQGNKLLPMDSSYTFDYSALNIRIDFTAISFKSAGDNIYLYKLEGLDTGWNNTTNTFVSYPTLPSGSYTFIVKAINKFGVESETKRISITVTPPWWQTGWFITLAGMAFASLVFFIYRRNIAIIKRRERVKRHNEARFAALEQQALQAQMNPHFIFNCLNSIQSFILDLDAEGANQYLSAFASMIRQTLDISSHPLITVAEEVRYLETYLQLEKLRFREKFNYRIEIDEEIDTFDTWIPGMFMQPYIENSLRHGIQHRTDNEGLIVLSIRGQADGGIICRVRDNGVGRKKAAEMKSSQHIEYQSKGTLINSKRINAINNQFDTNIHVAFEDVLDDNGEVAGTQVSIIIPELRKP